MIIIITSSFMLLLQPRNVRNCKKLLILWCFIKNLNKKILYFSSESCTITKIKQTKINAKKNKIETLNF